MATDADVKKALELYDDKCYMDAFDIGSKLIEEGIRTKETYSVCAKAGLRIASPYNEESLKWLAELAGNAVAYVQSYAEFEDLKYEFLFAANEWKRDNVKTAIQKLDNEYTYDVYEYYYKMSPQYPLYGMHLLLQLGMAQQKNEKIIVDEKHRKAPPANELSNTEEAEMLFGVVRKHFAECENISRQLPSLYVDAAKSAGKKLIFALGLSKCICGWICDKEDIEKKYLKKYLSLYANVCRKELTCVAYVNGNPFSLITDVASRRETYKELEEIYKRIKEIEPSFEIPQMPSVEPIQLQASQSNGGCYVATAVYGSYDCPEVWILRRFRDYTLAETWYGRVFIRTYYAISPTLVKWFGETEWFKKLWKGKLDNLVKKLQEEGFENTPYTDKNW